MHNIIDHDLVQNESHDSVLNSVSSVSYVYACSLTTFAPDSGKLIFGAPLAQRVGGVSREALVFSQCKTQTTESCFFEYLYLNFRTQGIIRPSSGHRVGGWADLGDDAVVSFIPFDMFFLLLW